MCLLVILAEGDLMGSKGSVCLRFLMNKMVEQNGI